MTKPFGGSSSSLGNPSGESTRNPTNNQRTPRAARSAMSIELGSIGTYLSAQRITFAGIFNLVQRDHRGTK